MLKLGAIDLHDGVGIAIKHFRGRFDHARFSRTGWAKKKHRADRPVWRIHSRQKNLVKATHAPDGAFLTNDTSGKPLFEILSPRALLIGIEENRTRVVHRSCHVHLS